jgi:large subunit ribosomal protein L4
MPEAAPSAKKLAGQGTVKLPAGMFSEPFHNAIVYEAVRAEQLARRRGTAATRSRGEVSGGGAKPWRQKGTGRARAGSIRAPHWTGGGVAFGPDPRGYTVKVNRKARRRALRAALSVHARRGSVAVLDGSAYDEPSTRSAAEALESLDNRGRVLVVIGSEEAGCAKSFRNISRVVVLPARSVGVADVVGAATLVVSEAALGELSEATAETVRAQPDRSAERAESAT